jgi:hypothetical protein
MKRKERSRADYIKDAACAMSDLTIFNGVIALLEGGTLHEASYRAQERLIAICKAEAAKRLKDYDWAVSRALAS